MNKKTTLTTLVLTLIAFTSNLFAQEQKPLKLKSEGLAYALAFDPIPGDALFYAGKPMQGVISSILGVLGGLLITNGIMDKQSPCSSHPTDLCLDFSSTKIILGAIPYAGSLIWDGIGGVYGVKTHNERVKKQAITFAPEISVNPTNGSTYAGIKIGF